MAKIKEMLDSSKDFNDFIAYWRAIDISDYLGGDRKVDSKLKGQHLQIYS